MKTEIDFDDHALFRLIQRGNEFGLDYFESEKRTIFTIKNGKPCKKHNSKKFKTKCYYFRDNLAFYVIYKSRRMLKD